MARIREDLLPDTPLGRKITTRIRRRFDESYQYVSQNFSLWDDLEEQYRAYRTMDEDDRESLKKNQVQKIIVPIQFATAQTMLTFMMEVFTAIKPVLRVRGADPYSRKRANIMEVCLDYDYRGNRGYFTLQQWFLNVFRYGYCPMENSWGRRELLRNILSPGPSQTVTLDGQDFESPGALAIQKQYFTTFEGNKLQIIDPRRWFYDGRVELSRFQEGEYCGRRTQIHDNELRKLEDDGIFFNTTKIKTDASYSRGQTRDTELNSFNDNSRSRVVSPAQAFATDYDSAKKARMHINEEMIVEISPRDWDLGDEDRPEHWVFNLIDGTTIVRAEPSEFIGPFPYSVPEVYPDILASMSFGLMELTAPLARHLDFMFNSHMANVRKAVNDMLLVDPSRLDLRDLLDPRAGKVIRLLPLAYGTDPSAAIKQLVITDITQGHIQDAKMILDLWTQITGVSPQMFGSVSGSRRTAAELQGVLRMSSSRMKMLADLMSSEGVAPLTEQMAFMRQSNMTQEQFMEIAGHSAQDLGVRPEDIIDGFLKVRRDHLDGNFYFPAEEGVMPQDRAKAAEILQKAFETVAKAPFLAQVFDPVEIFKETVRQFGLHNLDDFLRKGVRSEVQILPPDQIEELLRKGNIRPVGRTNGHVREEESGLDVKGYVEGAGAPRNG